MYIVHFMGGFANQVFQYAFYLNLCEKIGTKNVFADITHFKTCKDHGGFKLDKFVKFKYINPNKIKSLTTVTENNFDQINYEDEKNYFFYGYWQEKRFFPSNKDKIKDIFCIINLLPRNLNILENIKNSNSISIHIRRGDYVNNYMHGNIANKEYFENAINFINSKLESPTFFVFSDDINWCKENLDFQGKQVIYISGNSNNVEQDIILMSQCKHNIISNSSFSWWAQELNENKEKIVVTPEYWFNAITPSVKELKVENSIKIKNVCLSNKKFENPFFSIIIPVYNTSTTLRRTLASVLNQTYKNIEVIIVNDFSTDNSLEIIKDYSSIDSRIQVINNESNYGLLYNRIKGIHLAKSEYILFLDSDDWLELNTLEILYKKINNSNIDVLEFGYINEPSRKKSQIDKSYTPDDILNEKIHFTIWNKVYNRKFLLSFINNLPIFYCNYAEDAFFSLISAYYCKSYSYLEVHLLHYMEGTGISTQKIQASEKVKRLCTDLLAVANHLKKFYLEKSREDLIPKIDKFISTRLDNIIYHVDNDDDLQNTIQNFMVIDSIMSTDTYNKKVLQIQKKISLYNRMAQASILGKIKIIVKYIIKKGYSKCHQ